MGFEIIRPQDMTEIIANRNAIVVDVRDREEYRTYHYRSAYNYPYEEIDQWSCRLSKRRAIILYCAYGSTSILAARRLAQAGYEVYTVTGGIHAIRQYFHD